jgi:hypothetical protein
MTRADPVIVTQTLIEDVSPLSVSIADSISGYVLTWKEPGTVTAESLFLQVFEADGTPRTEIIAVSPTDDATTETTYGPVFSGINDEGGVTLAYQQRYPNHLLIQQYAADGVPRGEPYEIFYDSLYNYKNGLEFFGMADDGSFFVDYSKIHTTGTAGPPITSQENYIQRFGRDANIEEGAVNWKSIVLYGDGGPGLSFASQTLVSGPEGGFVESYISFTTRSFVSSTELYTLTFRLGAFARLRDASGIVLAEFEPYPTESDYKGAPGSPPDLLYSPPLDWLRASSVRSERFAVLFGIGYNTDDEYEVAARYCLLDGTMTDFFDLENAPENADDIVFTLDPSGMLLTAWPSSKAGESPSAIILRRYTTEGVLKDEYTIESPEGNNAYTDLIALESSLRGVYSLVWKHGPSESEWAISATEIDFAATDPLELNLDTTVSSATTSVLKWNTRRNASYDVLFSSDLLLYEKVDTVDGTGKPVSSEVSISGEGAYYFKVEESVEAP